MSKFIKKIYVKAHPKSKKIQVLQLDEDHYEVWVRQAPDKGKANDALIKVLSKYLNIPCVRISISSGLTSCRKVFTINV